MTDFAVEEMATSPNFENGLIGDWVSNPATTLSIAAVAGQSFSKALQMASDGTALIEGYESKQAACIEGQSIYLSAELNSEGVSAVSLELGIFTYNSTGGFITGGATAAATVASGQPWGIYQGSVIIASGIAALRPRIISTGGIPSAGDIGLLGWISCSRYDPSRKSWLWLPSYNTKTTQKPRVLEANFGDGYSQRAADGINTNPESWDLKFTARNEADAVAMDDFLVARGGHESFQWIAPNNMNGAPNVPLSGNPKLYICKQHDITRMQGPLFEVTATFDEVFDL